MAKNVLVSICLLCYNHENYITDCLESIMDQTWENMELIIWHNKSADRTGSKVRQYLPRLKERFERVVFIDNPENAGIARAVNGMIELARGTYIKEFSGDDMMLPNCIKAGVSYLEEHTEDILCYSNGYLVKETDRYQKRGGGRNRIYIQKWNRLSPRMVFEKTLLEGNCIIPIGLMIRKEAFDLYGKYDENIGYEDTEYFLRLSLHNETFGYIDECLVLYRRGDSSITNFTTRDGSRKQRFMMLEEKKVMSKYMKYLKKDTQRYRCLENYYNRNLMLALKYMRYGMALQIFYKMKKQHIKVTLK